MSPQELPQRYQHHRNQEPSTNTIARWVLTLDKFHLGIKIAWNEEKEFKCLSHGLSPKDVWVSFGHPNPQKTPFRTLKIFCEEFLKVSISSIQLNFFHLNIIHMALYMDIILYH